MTTAAIDRVDRRTGWARLAMHAIAACVIGAACLGSAGVAAAQEQGDQAPQAERRRYDDHAIVSIRARTHRELMAVMALGEMLNCRPSAITPIELLLPTERLGALDEAGLEYRMVAENAQALIDAEAQLRSEARAAAEALAGDDNAGDGFDPFFVDYRSPVEINNYITQIANDHPALATRFLVGNSLQQRPIYAIRLTSDPADTLRPIVVIQGCQHAREWISPATVVWAIQHMARGYGIDEDVTRLLDTVEWHFIPVVNPDGYQYSIDVDRFWRKNRRPNSNGSFGVDLNRNWSFQWGLPSGSSGNPSSLLYRGPSPFSEPETTVVAQYICSLNGGTGLGDCPPGRVLAALDVHSYSQLILGPWSYSETIAPPREPELRIVQEAMEEAMSSANGVQYIAGLGIDNLLYEASGTAQDWNFGQHQAVAWTYELRPNSPNPGFVLPPSQIVPTAIETFAGFQTLGGFVIERIVFELPSPPTLVQAAFPEPIAVRAVPFNRNEIEPGSLALFYRPAGSSAPFQSVPLLPAGPDYAAFLPPLACGASYEYFVQGSTIDGIIVQHPDLASDPASGDPLFSFAAANISGPFSPIPGTILPCPVSPCPGDANGNGAVNSDDLGILLGLFGASVTPGSSADFNSDGSVNSDDLSILLGAFGQPC